MAKYIHITMPDGSVWKVPADSVARDRAKYYAKQDTLHHSEDYQAVYDNEYRVAMRDHEELIDWAANNMNWSDVAESATEIPRPPRVLTPSEFQEGWMNGEKSIVEEAD